MARDMTRGQTNRPLAKTTASALQGRQSVRATFRLTAACIEAITVVATQLGIKQKSLFDHITEDLEVLERLAGRAGEELAQSRSRVQKTYVVSRRSLRSLEQISQTFNTPRDALIELSVKRLLPVIEREQRRHRQRKQMLASIENHFTEGQRVLKNVERVLGQDDVVYNKLESAMSAYASALNQISAFVVKGEVIEAFDLETLKAAV